MENINEIIYTSDQLSRQHVQYARKILSEPGIRWGIRAIDDRIIPSRGGDVSVILGRPGDGKTSCLAYLAAHQAREIVSNRKNHEETVVYVTWEGTVDKIYTALLSSRGDYSSTDFYWARVPIERAEATAVTSGIMPITFIGFSSFRRTSFKRITLDDILEAVEAIEKGTGTPQRKVTALFLDYAQLIPVPGTVGRTESTSEAIIGIKNLGVRLDIPSFVGGQAGRQVDSYQIKVAGPADAQHSCLVGDVKIMNACNGNVVTAKDVYGTISRGGKFYTHSMSDDFKIVKSEIIGAVKNEPSEIFAIDCGSCGSIKTTENHRFYSQDGWKTVSGLKADDWIARPSSMRTDVVSNSIGYDFAYVIGLLLGDGCLTRSIVLTNKDLVVHADFKEAVEREWPGYTVKINERKRCSGVYDGTIKRTDGRVFPGCNDVLSMFKKIGLFGVRCGDKYVPDLPMDDHAVRGILSGLFSSDGCVTEFYKRARVGFVSQNKALAEQVMYLLFRLGICSTISRTEQGRYNPLRTVSIVAQDVYKFSQEIHISGERGVRLLDIINRSDLRDNVSHSDLLPPAWNMNAIDIIKENKLRGVFNNVKGRAITRDRMARIAIETKSDLLKLYTECQLHWVKIKSVNTSGIEETYDFSVADNHNFIADSFVVHNSQIEQHVDYGYSLWRPVRTEPYDPNTANEMNIWGRRIEISPRLLIMKNWKQRGDDIGGWWPLYLQPEFLRLAELELEIAEEG